MPGSLLPDIAGLAGLAEQAGLDGVWAGDRLAAGDDAEYQAAGFRRSDRAKRTDEFLALLPGLLAGQLVTGTSPGGTRSKPSK